MSRHPLGSKRSSKIGRNDFCWCGSGLKYKKCHLGRESQEPLPEQALRGISRQSFNRKVCLHPAASSTVCTKIVDAHTVQRARTLDLLVDASNHVLTFYPYIPDDCGAPTLRRRGWREASTFTGFCAYHDSETFAPVERKSFSLSDETAFLLTYRALCHELFQKESSAAARQKLRQLVDRGTPLLLQAEIQRRHALGLAGVRKAVADLHCIKSIADQTLLTANYADWAFAAVTFSGSLSLATAGAPTPTQDLDGHALQTLHDRGARLEHLFVSVVGASGSPIVVFGWLREHTAPARMVESLLAVPEEALPSYVAQFIFAHLENVYFSVEWWNGLSSELQEHIRSLAGNANPYYFPPAYVTTPIVPWRVISSHRFGGINI